MREAIAITGVGAVCSAGTGAEHLQRLLHPDGRAFHRTTRFGDALSAATAFGIVPGHDAPMGELPDGAPQRLCIEFGVQAAREALGVPRSDPARIGLVVGSNLEDYPESLAALTAAIAD